jgi:hypothetical protein
MLTLLEYVAITAFESCRYRRLSLKGVWQFEFLLKLDKMYTLHNTQVCFCTSEP